MDGSSRTLTCVEVIPSTGATVGKLEGGGGGGVSDGREVSVGADVDVTMNAVGEGVSCSRILTPHAAPERVRMANRISKSLRDTCQIVIENKDRLAMAYRHRQ